MQRAWWLSGARVLAQKVIHGLTKGYVNHPQLDRFKNQLDPIAVIFFYLTGVYAEAERRGYRFNRSKISEIACSKNAPCIAVSSGQMIHEFRLLKKKLSRRDPEKYRELSSVETADDRPAFEVFESEIEPLEQIR